MCTTVVHMHGRVAVGGGAGQLGGGRRKGMGREGRKTGKPGLALD